MLHNENQLQTLPGSALKVCVVGGVGGWWWWLVESEFSYRLWLSFSLALAKLQKMQNFCLGGTLWKKLSEYSASHKYNKIPHQKQIF